MEVQQQCPDDFKCPISLEVMSDPVILTSGHTFDRSSIERWLDSGNRTCPVTKLPLPPHPPLIPNHALRSLISNFTPTSPPYLHPRPSPVGTLDLLSSLSFPSDAQTLAGIRQLSKVDSAFRRLVADSGAVTVLLRHVADCSVPDIQELALRIVLDVSLEDDDVKVGLVADGAVDAVVEALLRGGVAAGCRALAATTLTSLAVADVNKCTIGAHPSAIEGLVALLGSDRSRERREAATALYALCSFQENRRRAVQCGAVPVLVELAQSGLDRAVEVLEFIAKCREGKVEIRKVESFVNVMVSVLRRGGARGIEHSLLVLNLVCSDSMKMRSKARKEGVLDIVFSLMSESGKIGNLAGGLVKALQMRDPEELM